LTGVPAEGAIASTPDIGRVIAVLPMPLWVYEDGRVISAHYNDHEDWNGLLEQRLSPSGVELVRAEILAHEPFAPQCGGTGGWYAYSDGAREVCEIPGENTYWLRDTRTEWPRLFELLYGASSWLPASAWVDSEPKPYVPSTYEVGISLDNDVSSVDQAFDTATMLAALPPDVAEVLTRPQACAWPPFDSVVQCYRVTTDEARLIEPAILPLVTDGNGSAPFGHIGDYWVRLSAYLPHGAPLQCCGG